MLYPLYRFRVTLPARIEFVRKGEVLSIRAEHLWAKNFKKISPTKTKICSWAQCIPPPSPPTGDTLKSRPGQVGSIIIFLLEESSADLGRLTSDHHTTGVLPHNRLSGGTGSDQVADARGMREEAVT